MIRKDKLVTNSYYHVYNRGTDKRKIFLDKQDYYRFIHYLYEFNDDVAVTNFSYYESKYPVVSEDIGLDNHPISKGKGRDKLVEIICFVLMSNHYHLLLKQLKDKGISKFMLKVGTGYAMYFNQKYKRTGRLFEGTFKSILVDRDSYIIHLSRYIHLNPVERMESAQGEDKKKEWGDVADFLSNYKWSSYLDYIGKKNFPSVIDKSFILGYFNNDTENYLKFVVDRYGEDTVVPERLLLDIY